MIIWFYVIIMFLSLPLSYKDGLLKYLLNQEKSLFYAITLSSKHFNNPQIISNGSIIFWVISMIISYYAFGWGGVLVTWVIHSIVTFLGQGVAKKIIVSNREEKITDVQNL